MKKFTLVCLLLLLSFIMYGQNNDPSIAKFAIWKPNRHSEEKFTNGYKQHLQWHRANNDSWNWYGWYFISGPRAGQFMDATFGHTWEGLGKPVNPSGDAVDNQSNVYPFAELQSSFVVQALNGSNDTVFYGFKTRLLRYIVLSGSDAVKTEMLVKAFHKKYILKKKLTCAVYKMIDGGMLNNYLFLIGLPDSKDMAAIADFDTQLYSLQAELHFQTITSISSEMLRFRDDMSLNIP
jgi:hypothetical protein